MTQYKTTETITKQWQAVKSQPESNDTYVHLYKTMKNYRVLFLQMFEASEALFCLRMLLRDFTFHHIDMTCVMMETCGIFLYHTPTTRPATAKRLEEMMRFKTATNMDPR